ncbi:methyl-accepting chemotaxis protein [Lachnoclostridium phytofermentans]|uniref:methyl-accepting chemotaxis protein n=1 Tax=Lachnoclostridium phytofermentans TaxID=66219 RepID=UPI000690BE51|nr:methyl-accepting chemotaxis protein [Lachnoclostridium phytofermentans]
MNTVNLNDHSIRKEMKKTVKTSMFRTMKVKVIGVVLIITAIASIFNLLTAFPSFEKAIDEKTKTSMMDITGAYGHLLQNEMDTKDQALTYEDYMTLLHDTSLEGIPSSYAYVVDKAGIMLYHPTEDKVGAEVENSVVKGIVEQIKQGVIPENNTITYEFQGVMKYAGYYISDTDNFILVLTADESEVMLPMEQFNRKMINGNIFILIIAIIVGIIIAYILAKPTLIITEAVNRISELNFTEDDRQKKLDTHRDEFGDMSRAIGKMRENIIAMINSLTNTSNRIGSNAEELTRYANEVNENSSDNSATAEELAAGMEETSATTESINANIVYIEDNTKEISHLTEEGKSMAQEIMQRAEELHSNTEHASDLTKQMYEEVRVRTTTAIEKSKSVERIQTLSKAIMEIASQTSLLSLNASIEAARAGESGRGFAVVATEIGNLANQSTRTVKDITDIVEEVQDAVNNMADCLSKTLDFLENTVLNDYTGFRNVSTQYSDDALKFNDSMSIINTSIDGLQTTIKDIAEAINGINDTVSEAATGVTDIAQKTSNTVELTGKTSEKVSETLEHAKDLQKIVEQFKI